MRYLFRMLMEKIRSYYEEGVDWSKIDTSFIVCSDHPVENNGWAKGWVKSKNQSIICAHAYPTVGLKLHIFVNGTKIFNVIKSLEKIGTDTVLCTMEEDWPDITLYDVAAAPKNKQLIAIFDQKRNILHRRVNDRAGVYTGSYIYKQNSSPTDKPLVAGDSGMPWICWQDNTFKVLSHSYRGEYGMGPKYYTFL